eukprot:XP_024997899.1 DNA repair protein XRCC1-like [Gallus gallus]
MGCCGSLSVTVGHYGSLSRRHRVENLLHPEGGGTGGRGGRREKRISAVLQLQRPQRIHSVHIGNDGAAFVELLVAVGGGDFQVLLPTAAFLSPSESRSGAALQRVRIFGPTALLGGAQGGQWDRVRVVCTQPYCTTRPFGLSFIRLFSPPSDGEGEKTKALPRTPPVPATPWPPCRPQRCAFPRTPKAAAARAMGGVVVTPAWIWDCQRLQKRLPCEPYLLDGSASSGSDGEEEPNEAPPTSRPRPAHRGGASPAKPRPPTPPSSNGDTPEGDAEDSAGDTEDELRRVTSVPPDDPYGGSTEENTDSDDDPIPPLPDFFEDKTFFLYGDFGATERRRLQRFVIAFGGTVAPYMSEAVTHVVTAQEWDSTFEEALELNPSLQFVRPRWVLLCAERLRPLPPQPYAVVPRDVTVTSP